MEQATYVKRFMLWTGVIAAVVMAVLHIIFFKQVEETFFLEVAKRVLVSEIILFIYEVFAAFLFGPMCYHFIYEKRKKK